MRWVIMPVLAVALAACGFRPMYAPSPSGASPIGAVTVSEIDGKAGHIMRAELVRMLGAETEAGTPRRLDVQLTERVNRLGIRLDASASRADLIVTARYALEGVNGEPPLTGSLQTVVSFDIPTAAYGEIAAQDDARERAGEVLAQQLRAELAIRLARPAS